MKTKTILAVALAAMTTLASCSKEETGNNPKDGETTRVVLNVEQALETRGIGNSVNKHAVQFADGWLVFADGAKKATNVFKIVTTTPATGSNEIKMDGTLNFDDISGESRNVYILGNVPSITDIADGTDMDALVKTTTTAKSQTNSVTASSVAGITLYGMTASIDHGKTPSEATVSVAPISSRVEIHQFTGGGNVTAYKVEGIFMNNFYNSITYAGGLNTVSGNDKQSLGKADQAKFTAGGTTYYSTGDAGIFYDEAAAGLGTLNSLITTPSNGVWAYNVPAPTGGEFPHIVIRVSGVTGVDGIDAADTKWMTVTKFIYADGANVNTEVAAFEPGKIYKITDFAFDESHLDVAPEMKTVAARVTVELAEWEPISVKPW